MPITGSMEIEKKAKSIWPLDYFHSVEPVLLRDMFRDARPPAKTACSKSNNGPSGTMVPV